MFLYVISPIDFFAGCVPIEKCDEDMAPWLLRCAFEVARSAEAGAWWKGEARYVHVFAVPGDGNTDPGLIWKGDNGTTYVCSPVEMPWLDRVCLRKLVKCEGANAPYEITHPQGDSSAIPFVQRVDPPF